MKENFFQKLFGKKTSSEDLSDRNLNKEEQEMVQGIVELSEKTAKDIMVPRTDVAFIPADITHEEILRLIIDSGFSRFPVYEETIDNVIGVLYVKDILRFIVSKSSQPIKSIVRKPYFIPETKKINSLFHEFRRKKVHIAVVVDEYGGVSGIICLEDILEEIVGDIQDEFDDDEEDILKISPNTYICDTRIDVEDLNKELGIKLPHEDYDTLGGLVFDLFGKIPVKNEKITHDGINFIIQDMDGNKIKSVKIEIIGNKDK